MKIQNYSRFTRLHQYKGFLGDCQRGFYGHCMTLDLNYSDLTDVKWASEVVHFYEDVPGKTILVFKSYKL